MSDDDGTDETSYRTLGTVFRSRPDTEMDVVGWSVFLGMLILLVPLLPFLILLHLIVGILDAITRRRG